MGIRSIRRIARGMRRLACIASLLAFGGCTGAGSTADQALPAAAARRNLPAQQGKPYVVMVSFDGFRHDYTDRWNLPALTRMEREGARAKALVSTFPSKTFPNHYAIASGMYAGHHGLVGNEMWDPAWGRRFLTSRPADTSDPRWFGGEPIWVTAEKQGMLSAAYFWPGSEAPIGGVLPTYNRPYDVTVPDSVRVDGLLAWLALPAERRPHLLVAYLSDVDEAAHSSGPESPATERAAHTVDDALARLRAGIARLPLADSVTMLVVSDHGLAAVRLGDVEALDGYASLADTVAVVTAGPYAQLFFGGDAANANRAWRALQRLPHSHVWRRGDIPPRLHLRGAPRAGDVLVLMDPPYQIERHHLARTPQDEQKVMGNHGYDPAVPDMWGILFAAGRGIQPGSRLGEVENVNVYPLVAHLLGLHPADGIDGTLAPMRPILRR
ncbi:MAG: type phosphodiesterase/nucleotide pyrophosphatase [Gemmatimonadetes bacterium]|nr:type phosphodiesterase/nucleotide pyrophosphatase [Gemmatimonadota bacterium]